MWKGIRERELATHPENVARREKEKSLTMLTQYGLKPDDGLETSRLWNEAVRNNVDPHEHIRNFIKQQKEEAERKRLSAYEPEKRPAPTGKRYRMVNGVVEFY